LSITLFYRVQLIGIIAAAFLCSIAHNSTHASEISTDVGATLVDPLLINVKEAKRFCKEEPQTVKCDILRENLKGKKVKIGPVRNHTYNILSANFE
jgi:hypothetical protein